MQSLTEQSLFEDITPTPIKYKQTMTYKPKCVAGRHGNIEPLIAPEDPNPTEEEKKILAGLEHEFDAAWWQWDPDRFLLLAQWFYMKAMDLHTDFEEFREDD